LKYRENVTENKDYIEFRRKEIKEIINIKKMYNDDEVLNREVIFMNAAQAIEEIDKYGITSDILNKEYGISAGTLSNYKKKKKAPSKRQSSQSKVLEVLYYALRLISSHPGVNPLKELRDLRFAENLGLKDLVKKYEKSDIDLIKLTVKETVERKLNEKQFVRALDRFKEKYTYVNDETLEKASEESPDLVQGIVLDENINTLARAHALYALSLSANDEYFSFIKGFVNHSAPLIRESAIMGLYEYYDLEEERHLEVKDSFKEILNHEKAKGIRSKTISLLEQMEQ
jgi:hypothetical protein